MTLGGKHLVGGESAASVVQAKAAGALVLSRCGVIWEVGDRESSRAGACWCIRGKEVVRGKGEG